MGAAGDVLPRVLFGCCSLFLGSVAVDIKAIVASLLSLVAGLFGPLVGGGVFAPVVPVETFKADTAAMVVYASLADEQVAVKDAASVRCLVFSFQGCSPCEQLHRTIDKELVPDGWRVGSRPTDDIEFVDVYSRDERVKRYKQGRSWMCPTLVLVDASGKELARKVGAMGGKELSAWIKSHRK
jgi:thioredoxin-related protein